MMRIRKMLCAALAVCMLGSVLPSLAEGTTMKALQERLISLGYEIGTADGIVGKKTSAAIMLVQEALRENGHNVQPSGTPDPETVSLIMQEENADLLRTLRPGSWGSRVKQAQRQLAGLNLLQDSADGKYGANTENAVKAFEEAMAKQLPEKVNTDGRLTPDEYNLLMGDLRAYGFEAPICFDESHPEKLNGNYLYAKHACLINAVTGKSLLDKDADTPAEPASTTKIMTLITALPLCDPDKGNRDTGRSAGYSCRQHPGAGISRGKDDHEGSSLRNDDPFRERCGELSCGAVFRKRGRFCGRNESKGKRTGNDKLPFRESAWLYGGRTLHQCPGPGNGSTVRPDAAAVQGNRDLYVLHAAGNGAAERPADLPEMGNL